MKIRTLVLILLLAAAVTWVYRDLNAAAAKPGFAQKHPKAAKIIGGAAKAAKWAGFYFLLAEDEPPAAVPAIDEDHQYADDPQHYASNQPPAREVGKDGFLVIQHGKGW